MYIKQFAKQKQIGKTPGCDFLYCRRHRTTLLRATELQTLKSGHHAKVATKPAMLWNLIDQITKQNVHIQWLCVYVSGCTKLDSLSFVFTISNASEIFTFQSLSDVPPMRSMPSGFEKHHHL